METAWVERGCLGRMPVGPLLGLPSLTSGLNVPAALMCVGGRRHDDVWH